MKFPGGDSEVLDPLLLSSWSGANDHFLVEGSHKLIDPDEDEEESKPDMDDLELLLTTNNTSNGSGGSNNNHHHHHNNSGGASNNNNNNNSEPNNNSLAELKPLPPFTGYTGHLSINGISGHHYHTIATAPSAPRLPTHLDNHHQHYHNSSNTNGSNNGSSGGSTSSSNNGSDISDHSSGGVTAPTVYYSADQQVSSSTMPDVCLDTSCIKTESSEFGTLLTPEIEDIARLIGSAIAADTTVPSGGDNSRDSWIDLDAWIEGAVGQTTGSNQSTSTVPVSKASGTTNASNDSSAVLSAETLQEFMGNLQFSVAPQVSAQSLYHQHLKREPSSGCMPILQSRLTKPDTLAYMVAECTSPSSSTPNYLAHSPPSHVVSTSDLQVRYNPVHSSTRPSPELQVGFPHTTTPNKKSKNRNKSKTTAAAATSTVVYSEGALGKEKPVHRCTICNRGFLNKSNIKVHLRTHTGEKPFRCEVCGKAFRQKAHLIKHAQIHKRIGRD